MLDQNKPVDDLLGPELGKLILMYHIPKEEHRNNGEKQEKWEEINECNKSPPVFQQ